MNNSIRRSMEMHIIPFCHTMAKILAYTVCSKKQYLYQSSLVFVHDIVTMGCYFSLDINHLEKYTGKSVLCVISSVLPEQWVIWINIAHYGFCVVSFSWIFSQSFINFSYKQTAVLPIYSTNCSCSNNINVHLYTNTFE